MEAFRSGEWLPRLVAQTFRAYYANATTEFFRNKYPNHTDDQIFQKLRKSAIRQAGLVGAICGAAMSANELTALATGGELFVGLAGNLALAGLTIAADLVGVTVVQLRLVMQIAKLYGVEIDLEDPEDVWVILAFAVGGEVGQEVSQVGARVGGHLTKQAIKKHLSGEILATAKRYAAKIGIKLLQRTTIQLAVPGVSVLTAAYLNRRFTAKFADLAKEHFQEVAAERSAIQSAESQKQGC